MKPKIKKGLELKGLPKPQNGQVYGKIVTLEHTTKAGIIIPDTGSHTTRMDYREKDIMSFNPRPLILEVIDFAPELQKLKSLKKGDYIMVNNRYAETPTQLGNQTFIIIHETGVDGVW